MNSKMWNENVHWVIEWLIDWRCRVNAEWILNTPPFLLHCTSGQTTGERCLWLGLEWINHTDVGLMNTTSPHSYYTLALVLHFTFPFPHLNLPPLHLFPLSLTMSYYSCLSLFAAGFWMIKVHSWLWRLASRKNITKNMHEILNKSCSSTSLYSALTLLVKAILCP